MANSTYLKSGWVGTDEVTNLATVLEGNEGRHLTRSKAHQQSIRNSY